jgi:hypothetical protein
VSDRDPTTGELAVMLDQILRQLGNVATKEFVQTKFDAFNDRVARLEADQKEWTKVSTAAHVELDRDSKARHQESIAATDALEIKMNTRIDLAKAEAAAQFAKIHDDQVAGEKEVKAVRNSRITTWIGIGLTWLGGLVLYFLDRGTP